MLTSEMPFNQEESQLQLKAQESRAWTWSDKMTEHPTAQLNSIMKAMFEPDPLVRIRMPALVVHPWIASEFRYSKRFFEPRKVSNSGSGVVAPPSSSSGEVAKTSSSGEEQK